MMTTSSYNNYKTTEFKTLRKMSNIKSRITTLEFKRAE